MEINGSSSDNHLVTVSLHFFLLFLNILNTILHSFGTYLLISVYRRTQQKVQRVLLVNLSVTEALMNFLEIVRIVPDVMSHRGKIPYEVDEIRNCILIITFTGLYFVYYLDMIYITLDRLFDIVLNIKYPIYCTVQRAKKIIMATWVVGLISCICEAVYYHYHRFSWEKILFTYFFPPIQFAYLILAFTTYGFIFHKYKQANLHPPGGSVHSRVGRRPTSWQLFRGSRFYISVLLIITFIIFMIIPDMAYIFSSVVYGIQSEALITGCLICYAFSNLIDSVIYIFLEEKIRKSLRRRFMRFRRNNQIRARSLFHSLPRIDRWSMTNRTNEELSRQNSNNNNLLSRERRYAFYIPNICEPGNSAYETREINHEQQLNTIECNKNCTNQYDTYRELPI